jgi:hypothetical protein
LGGVPKVADTRERGGGEGAGRGGGKAMNNRNKQCASPATLGNIELLIMHQCGLEMSYAVK